MLLSLCLVVLYNLNSCVGQIQILQSRNYSAVWSSADKKLSLWKPEPPAPGYYLLGDVAVVGNSEPVTSYTFVKAYNQSDSLAAPLRYNEVWSDQRSVTVFELIAPYGYQCLGMVAVPRWPYASVDLYKYRCVKDWFLIQGGGTQVWKDTSSRHQRAGSLILTSAIPDTRGLSSSNCFQITDGTSAVSWVLNEKAIEFWESKPVGGEIGDKMGKEILKVKKFSKENTLKVWHPVDSDLGIYNLNVSDSEKAEGYEVLGSMLVKSNELSGDDVWIVSGDLGWDVQYPLNYTLVWSQNQPIPIFLWQPICPDYYVDFGIFATNTEARPVNATVCVHDSLVSSQYRYWSYAWSDRTYRHSLWLSSVREDIPTGSFTYQGGMMYPGRKPYSLNNHNIFVQPETYLVEYALKHVKFGDSTTFRSSNYLFYSDLVDNPDSPFQIEVTPHSTPPTIYRAICTVGLDTVPGTPLTISPALSPLRQISDRLVADTVQYLISRIPVLNEYVEYSVKKPTKINVQPGQKLRYTIYHRTYWIDIPFSSTLHMENSDPNESSKHSVTGNLNIVLDTYEMDIENLK